MIKCILNILNSINRSKSDEPFRGRRYSKVMSTLIYLPVCSSCICCRTQCEDGSSTCLPALSIDAGKKQAPLCVYTCVYTVVVYIVAGFAVNSMLVQNYVKPCICSQWWQSLTRTNDFCHLILHVMDIGHAMV